MCWPHVNPVPAGAVGKDCQRRLLSRPRFVRAVAPRIIYIYIYIYIIMYIFMSLGWDYVTELRPPTGPIFILQVTYESAEPQWNYTDREKPKNSKRTCPSVTVSATYTTWSQPGANPGLRGKRPATNRLSHRTVFRNVQITFLKIRSR
jgi:hypothetical protein